jgi:hypothetical protein
LQEIAEVSAAIPIADNLLRRRDCPLNANSRHYALSRLVMESTAYRIRGAANKTTGVIIAHEIAHDLTHWLANMELLKNGALEIPAATAQVIPD